MLAKSEKVGHFRLSISSTKIGETENSPKVLRPITDGSQRMDRRCVLICAWHFAAPPIVTDLSREKERSCGTGCEPAMSVRKRKVERYGEALTRECSRFTAESIPLSCRTGRLTLQGSAHSGLS